MNKEIRNALIGGVLGVLVFWVGGNLGELSISVPIRPLWYTPALILGGLGGRMGGNRVERLMGVVAGGIFGGVLSIVLIIIFFVLLMFFFGG